MESKETEIVRNEQDTPKQPAHKRGMLFVEGKEISPDDLLEKDIEGFKNLYGKMVWKLNSTSSKIDIYNNLLDVMEDAAEKSGLLLEDPTFDKDLRNRPRNAYASAKIALRLCTEKDRNRVLVELGLKEV